MPICSLQELRPVPCLSFLGTNLCLEAVSFLQCTFIRHLKMAIMQNALNTNI